MEHLPIFHIIFSLFQVMVVCLMRSAISRSGCALLPSITPRYLACLTVLMCFPSVNLGDLLFP